MLSLTLQQQHLKINEITNPHQSEQYKTSMEENSNNSDTSLDETIDSAGCVLVYKSKLLNFRIFQRQIVEVLTHHIIPGKLQLDTLQFINCNIPLLELSQLGKAISTSKCQWRCIDLSGCNIGDHGCAKISQMCKEFTKSNGVSIKLLNLTSNGLTSSSLIDICTMVLHWKIEKLIIACNDVHQYHLSHTISAMAQLENYNQFSFQIQITAEHKSIIIHNQGNCQQYLSKILLLENLTFGKIISDEINQCKDILKSSSVQPPILESYNTSFIPLPDILQQNPHVISTVSIGMNETQLYFHLKKGMFPYSNFIYVNQEVKYIAPVKHVHIINSNITTETACQVAKIIRYENLLESIELVNNNLAEEDIIKIMADLQFTLTLLYLCVSNNVLSNVAAQSFASAISDNFFLEYFQLSHCELKEQGMLIITESLGMVHSLQHFDLQGNYITNASAKLLASVIINSTKLTYLNLSDCKLQEVGLFCIMEALRKLSTVMHLNLSSNKMSNAAASLLSNVIEINVELHHLDLSRCMLKEKGMIDICKSIAKVLSLNYIDLSFNKISNYAAQNLAPALKNVRKVFFNNCNLHKQSVEKISSVLEMSSSIQELGLNEAQLYLSASRTVATMLSRNIDIKRLCISSCALTSNGFKEILRAIEMSSSIECLDVSSNTFDIEISKKLGEGLCRQKALQHLQISKCSFKEGGLKCMLKGLQCNKTNFYCLDTSYNCISSEAALELASVITSNPTMKHLILQHCNLQEQGLITISNTLKSLSCLRTLNISSNKISNKVALELKEAIALNITFGHLEMVCCNLTELGITAIANSLAKISSLTHLNIGYNSINDAAAEALAAALLCNTSIQHLDLSYCNIEENSFQTISKSLSATSKLRYLNLSNNIITNSVAEELTIAFYKTCNLNSLILCNCDIQELGFDMILGTLCGKNILHHLSLNCNVISDQTAAKICEVTATSTFLTELEIGSCNISGHGFRLIAESLMNDNKISLEHLNISFNTILFSAAESISTMFHTNKSLEHLDLSGCKLGESEFLIICKSLCSNVLLTHFNVSHNLITSKVAAEIAVIIDGNRTLQYVNLHNCNLRDDGISCIVDALCNVKTLKTFIASNNPAVSNASAKCIANVINRNTFLEQFDLSNCNLQEPSTSVIRQAAESITLKCLMLD